MKSQSPSASAIDAQGEDTGNATRLADWSPQVLWAAGLTLVLVFGQLLPAAKFFDSPATYLPLHTFMEFMAMAVSAMVLALAWNLRSQGLNSHRVILGAGFLAVALVDFSHTLSYPGMPALVTPSGSEKAINFWLAGRYIAAGVLMAIAVLPPRRWSSSACNTVFGMAITLVAMIFWLGISYAEWFPRTFIAGQGLTAFKIGAEYFVAIIYSVAAIRLYLVSRRTQNKDLLWLAAAAWVQGLAEMFFTLYADVTDAFNLLGHAYKAIAYLMVYRALFVAGVRAPYSELDCERSRLAALTAEQAATQLFLEEQNERFVMASNAANLGFWSYDTRLHTLKWDGWMFRIYACSKLDGDFPYAFWAKRVHPDDLARTEQELSDAINGIREFKTEFRIIHPDGSVRNIMAIASAIRDDHGHAIKMFGTNSDVTEARSAQQRQVRLVEKLTQANEELSNFTYVASHDLKSPLRGIDQLATWIAEDLGDKLGSDTQGHLRLMRGRIRRMEMLLDDLLAYSRIGRSDHELEAVNTRELVQDIFNFMTPGNPSMQLVVAADMPVLQTQKVPLELVFRNLIGNAIKHHDKAQGTIFVSAHPTANGFEFEVKDDGPGIPKEHQQRVFAMFQTLKSRDELEGSGIGLSIVKKAVEVNGGAVTLASDGRFGCSFRFTWPTSVREESGAEQ